MCDTKEHQQRVSRWGTRCEKQGVARELRRRREIRKEPPSNITTSIQQPTVVGITFVSTISTTWKGLCTRSIMHDATGMLTSHANSTIRVSKVLLVPVCSYFSLQEALERGLYYNTEIKKLQQQKKILSNSQTFALEQRQLRKSNRSGIAKRTSGNI